MARDRAARDDPAFAALIAAAESLPVESRTRDDRDDSLTLPFSGDSWVDQDGVQWSRPRDATLERLRKLLADPDVRVIHASWPDEVQDVEPGARKALFRTIEHNWRGRDEYLNGWQNYSARVFRDEHDRALLVIQQWCSP